MKRRNGRGPGALRRSVRHGRAGAAGAASPPVAAVHGRHGCGDRGAGGRDSLVGGGPMTYTLHTSGVLMFGVLLLGFALECLHSCVTADSDIGRIWHGGVCVGAAWTLLDLIVAVTR